jgi:hypothetical protein
MAHGEMYTGTLAPTAHTAAGDLMAITGTGTGALVLHSIHIGQTLDAGDAEAEMVHCRLSRWTTAGTGGTTPTPSPHNLGQTAASTFRINATVDATVLTTLYEFVFNVQAGLFYTPTPEEMIVVSAEATDGLVLALVTVPADSLTIAGSMTWEEIGG